MGNKRIPMEPGKMYHVYNHGNAQDNLFRCEENYIYFLKKYAQYIYPIVDTFAYCLMPNHFHTLVRVKTEEELCALNPQGFQNLANPRGLANLVGLDEGFKTSWVWSVYVEVMACFYHVL